VGLDDMERDASRLLVVRRMSGPVVFASYTGVMGGAERTLLDAVVRLERSVVIACPEGPLADAVRAAGLPHAAVEERPLALGAAHAAGLLAFGRELARLSRGAGALVAWGARAVLAAALVRRRPPLLAVHHDLLPGAQAPSRGGRRAAAARAAVRAATRRADGVAAASAAIAQDLGRPDAAILHPGVDLAAFSPQPLPAGPPHALVLGALVPWKRPDLAIHVADRMPELRVTIAGAPLPGSDGYADHLRKRAARLGGRVTLAGHVDPRAALARAHVLLHCAPAEPYGLALVEALACGRPVVAPDRAGPREIVQGGAGHLYRPGHANGAALALDAVLADPAAPAAARRRAEAAFDVEDSTRRLAEAIERL
jgi:glycosyltransferase involved in cell wall biosynthesis